MSKQPAARASAKEHSFKAPFPDKLAEVNGGKPFAAVAREKGKFPDGGDARQGSIAPAGTGSPR